MASHAMPLCCVIPVKYESGRTEEIDVPDLLGVIQLDLKGIPPRWFPATNQSDTPSNEARIPVHLEPARKHFLVRTHQEVQLVVFVRDVLEVLPDDGDFLSEEHVNLMDLATMLRHLRNWSGPRAIVLLARTALPDAEAIFLVSPYFASWDACFASLLLVLAWEQDEFVELLEQQV